MSKIVGEDNVPKLGIRHIQMGFMFLMLAIGMGMRIQLSVAIVAMTDSTTSPNPEVPTYDWDNKSVILSSFYWGYVVLQIVTAELGRKYGPKQILLASMFISSSATLLTPVVADKMGSYGVIVCRVLLGLAQGPFYASIHNVQSKWTTSDECARFGNVPTAGGLLGNIITMPLVGYISSSWLGWPCTFYLYGALGFAWTVLYFIFGANSPREHKTITDAERNYIEKHLDEHGSDRITPWKSILKSPPVWAILCIYVGTTFGTVTLIAEFPNYMNAVMGFSMKSNGLLSAAPHITWFLLSFVFAHLSDYAINYRYLSRTNTRKITTLLSCLCPAITLIIVSFLPNDASTLSVILLIATVGVQAISSGGFTVNNLDLSPNFAGVIIGICNTAGSLSSLFGPIFIQFVVTDESDKSQWRIFFIISAILYILPNIPYVLFASGEIQPWDNPEDDGKRTDTHENICKRISVLL
ncbi:hypothetical protein JTB14_016963 [Gonioctena quinquepunctata]|nr:hypothetical protein JTB14_016963 [Gonioctena quinquepunctata]